MSIYAPWITENIKKSMHNRDYLKKKAVKSGSRNVHEAYKRARNEVNKLVKNTKTKYFMNALSENNQNPKTMWNTIRTLTNKNSNHISSTIVNSHCLHQSVKQTDHRQIVPPWGKLYPPGAEPSSK